MDLHNAHRLNGTVWNCVRLGALLCLLLAGVLLAAALFLPPPQASVLPGPAELTLRGR